MNQMKLNNDIDNTTDEWRNVVGYEELYQISNHGRVKSMNYNRTGREGILKEVIDRNGYPYVNLHKDGKGKSKRIHRLVGIARLYT